jgi:Fe-S cluster assembly ATPase SufC
MNDINKKFTPSIGDKGNIKGNCWVKAGEIHAIMGPNGAGKRSTLLLSLQETKTMKWLWWDYFGWWEPSELAPEEEHTKVFFLSFQYQWNSGSIMK